MIMMTAVILSCMSDSDSVQSRLYLEYFDRDKSGGYIVSYYLLNN